MKVLYYDNLKLSELRGDDHLEHHGILGMKWGIRRYQPYSTVPRKSGKSGIDLKDSWHRNLDSLGKSPSTNVLYISGRSGSGKSTIARKIAGKNDRVVHLDSYFDNSNGDANRDKELDAYLDKHLPNHRMLGAPTDQISLQDWGKLCAKFEVELEKYGKQQYSNNKRVVVEGVELLDDTLRPNKNFFKDKPIILLKTNAIKSGYRAMKRDDVDFSFDEIRNMASNQLAWNRDIRTFKKEMRHTIMGKTMYYDNLLISDLMDGDHLEHHGVLGMKWGIRRYQSYSQVPRKSGEGGKEQGLARKKSKLEAKKAKNNAKIAKVQSELKKPRSAKDLAREKKYQAKLKKVNSQWITKAAERAEAKGEHAGTLGEAKLRQKAKYEAMVNKYGVRVEKLNAKLADLEYKNIKLDTKIEKLDTKIKDLEKRR